MSVLFKKTIQISLIITALFSIINFALAQQSTSNSVSSVVLNMSPYNPRAGDGVVLTLSSDSLDLDSSKITWYIDGVVRKETSSKSISIKAKTDGSTTSIKAIVETSDGITKEVDGDISPAGVDLVIEPMTYTLPFYEGKPFFVPLGRVKIVAIPDIMIDGVKMSSKDLNFKWTRDDNLLIDGSGKGQSTVILDSTIPVRDIRVGVQILDDSGNILAENSKLITMNDPQILFYEDNPLYGILYNKAVTGSYYLGTKEELDIIAKPFSFSFLNDTPETASYTWYVNDNSVDSIGKANEMIFKQTAASLSGTASVSLNVRNTNKINQYASGEFNVAFGE